jgi:hypothetical protein
MVRYRKPTPFLELSARRRARLYIRMKNRLRRAAPVLGGLFHTRDFMPLNVTWMNFGFLGKRHRVVYIASLRTVAYAFKGAVESAAWDEAEALAPYEPIPRLKTPADFDAMFSGGPTYYPQLDGLTRMDWIRREYRRIADSGKISVRDCVNIKRDCRWGISIDAVIDVPVLTIEVVNEFIRRFLATESESRGDKEFTFTYDEIGDWSMGSNYVAEPWEWADVLAEMAAPETTDSDETANVTAE